MEVKYWQHPTETITVLTGNNKETSTIQIFTDGSKLEQGVGAGVAICKSGTHITSLQYKLNKRCTNSQAEQLAILRALRVYRNPTNRRQDGHHIHRQQNDTRLAQK
jgi:hypothetical protein